MNRIQPNVLIPNRREAIQAGIAYEYMQYSGALAVFERSGGVDGDARRLKDQHEANMNEYLDTYPTGLRRNELPEPKQLVERVEAAV